MSRLQPNYPCPECNAEKTKVYATNVLSQSPTIIHRVYRRCKNCGYKFVCIGPQGQEQFVREVGAERKKESVVIVTKSEPNHTQPIKHRPRSSVTFDMLPQPRQTEIRMTLAYLRETVALAKQEAMQQ